MCTKYKSTGKIPTFSSGIIIHESNNNINSAYRRRSMEAIFLPRQWQYFT